MTTPTLSPAPTSIARCSTSCLGLLGDFLPSRHRREVAVAAPAPRVVPNHKWMDMLIGFDTSDCPKNMAGVGQLPLLVSSSISNIKMYHVQVDGGVALNLISLVAFKKMQIVMSKLTPSRPFSGVGMVSVMPCGTISLVARSGRLRTTAQRASSSTSWMSTSHSMPS
jgi:hypothetical protein